MDIQLFENSARRQDTSLRIAVDRVHNKLQHLQSEKQLIQLVTELLCELSESRLALAFKLSFDDQRTPYFEKIAAAESTPLSSVPLACSQHLAINTVTKPIYKAYVANCPTVFHQSELLTEINPNGGENKQAVMFPVHDVEKPIAMFFLFDAKAPYHINQIVRYIPLFNALNHVRRLLKASPINAHKLTKLEQSFKQNYSLLETLSPNPILILKKDLSIARINPSLEALLGYDNSQLVNEHISKIIPEHHKHQHKLRIALSFQHIGQANKQQITINTHDNVPLNLSCSIVKMMEAGEVRILVLMLDQHDDHSVQQRYELELARFKALSELVPIGILQTDENWHTRYVNNKWLETLGIERQDVDKLNWTQLFSTEQAESILANLYESLNCHQTFEFEGSIFTNYEKELWIHFEARPLFDMQGNLSGFIASIVDNTFHHNTEERLRDIAETDHLTKLPNRLALTNRLANSLERVERRGAMAMLSLDLDGFKNVNDTMGHDAGDKLLILVANRILKVLRKEDFLARLGGDEFIVLLEQLADSEVASAVANKVLSAINKPFIIDSEEVFISSSIGICFAVAGQKTTSTQLMKQADIAMYHAKDMGRNTIQYYSSNLDKISRDRLELGNSLHKAVSQKEFELFYQLQINNAEQSIIGLEALLRWRKNGEMIVGPDQFIPLLEEIGLIIPVGRFVIKQALAQLASWISAGKLTKNVAMAVNLSPKQFRDSDLIKYILKCIDDNNLQGHNLVLEVTETTLLQDNKEVTFILKELASCGIKIALDDFGTGYSSLSHLKNYPIAEIKIDRSFISDILTDESDREITKAVIAMAHALNIDIVAEGIENKEILDELILMKCAIGQGYFYNRPMPAADIEALFVQYKF
ncbi:EAL domain-containing protein [Thalassotalea sp. 1_MG-2023]|uniref:sensor domain-containing protein n=1 Tax=Thalassotalea sp. 1_MG-2023 TaxID=3062680 RepID=UPI0026E3F8DF|nr:GGDEF and EAL domain-containing protein [Thalassotalea sp. 1_MG-2023]MDO6425901.1 EAL domain-containing protein [Thalassotalea sp. 1_MG-2023]